MPGALGWVSFGLIICASRSGRLRFRRCVARAVRGRASLAWVPAIGRATGSGGFHSRSSVGTLVERKTRFVLLSRTKGNGAEAALAGFTRQMTRLPGLRRQVPPMGADLRASLHADLDHIARLRNDRPRKILGSPPKGPSPTRSRLHSTMSPSESELTKGK